MGRGGKKVCIKAHLLFDSLTIYRVAVEAAKVVVVAAEAGVMETIELALTRLTSIMKSLKDSTILYLDYLRRKRRIFGQP